MRLYEVTDCFTGPATMRCGSCASRCSKKSFDKLNKQQQNAVIAAGKGAQAYFESKADDVNDDVNKEAIKTFKDHRIPIITAARSASTSTL